MTVSGWRAPILCLGMSFSNMVPPLLFPNQRGLTHIGSKMDGVGSLQNGWGRITQFSKVATDPNECESSVRVALPGEREKGHTPRPDGPRRRAAGVHRRADFTKVS